MDFDLTIDGDMAVLQLYSNKQVYPQYSDNLTVVGSAKEVTPRNINFPEGFIDIDITYSDLTSANYLKLTRSVFSFYAFITRAEHLRGDKLYRLYYRVDAWRTYKSKIDLGNQYILRSPTVTALYDEMLGSTDPKPLTIQSMKTFPNNDKRVLVLQVMRDDTMTPASDYSWTPVQPSVYNFYCVEYQVNTWLNSAVLADLFEKMTSTDPRRIITMYSVPWFDLTDLPSKEVTINEPDGTTPAVTVAGLKLFSIVAGVSAHSRLEAEVNVSTTDDRLLQVDSSVSIVVPEGGVLELPRDLYGNTNIALRRTIDIFSGACNYMLVNATTGTPYTNSVRGASVSTIPVIGDPEQIYLSQNQNALMTSMIGDVATIAGGGALALSGGGAAVGGGMMYAGVRSLVSKGAAQKDASKVYSNPPAFLGSALAPFYNSRFWIIVKRLKIDNSLIVNSEYGYPYEMVDALTFPTTGYIQTQNCGVKSTDGTVPKWAIDEINSRFDAGIKVEV